jgi:hypothetical protein
MPHRFCPLSENLEALVQAEKENPDTFVPLPRHYIEVSKVLLDMYVIAQTLS